MENDLKLRTKLLGLKIIELVDLLPSKTSSWVIAKQIVRCSTSVGANFRAAGRSKSPADFIYKLKIVEEETDETIFWLEMIEESSLLSKEQLDKVKSEANEILAMIVASIKTARTKNPSVV
jgi:four helix bundle protein